MHADRLSTPSQSEPSDAQADRDARRGLRLDRARVALLGATAWAVLVALPLFLAGPRSSSGLAVTLLPLPLLVVGTVMLSRHEQAATWLLLGVYPTSLGAIAAGLDNLVLLRPYSTMGTLLGVASVIAYGAGAALATGRPRDIRSSTRRPLGSVAPIDEKPRRRRTRHALLLLATVGAAAIALVAPTMASPADYEAHWGPAAQEAAVLTAVVAGALGAVTLALFVGPTLRASRARPLSQRRVNRRVYGLLFSVFLGVAFYLLYRYG